jgi:hypothetical protein
VDEAPRGLEPSDFEDWLWKREKPKYPGQLADFRSRATFISFSEGRCREGSTVHDPNETP